MLIFMYNDLNYEITKTLWTDQNLSEKRFYMRCNIPKSTVLLSHCNLWYTVFKRVSRETLYKQVIVLVHIPCHFVIKKYIYSMYVCQHMAHSAADLKITRPISTITHRFTLLLRGVEVLSLQNKHGLEDSSGKISKKHSKEKGYISVLNWKLTAICASL